MDDINNKRITFISDTEVSMPIRWKENIENIRWNNAIAMAVTIARSIDKTQLWDGYLSFAVKTGTFAIDTKKKVFLNSAYTDTMSCPVEIPVSISASESDFHLHSSTMLSCNLRNYNDNLPMRISNVSAVDTTTISIVFANPVFSQSWNENLNAIFVTATFGSIEYTQSPTKIIQKGLNEILITVPSFEEAVGEINVLYQSENGNIMQYVTNTKIPSFNAAFTYTILYTEGE